jgi:hypothetical protein
MVTSVVHRDDGQQSAAFSLPASVLSSKAFLMTPMAAGAGAVYTTCILVVDNLVATPNSNGAECGSNVVSFYDLDGITFAGR